MLVISRREGQSLKINQDVVVEVLEVCGSRVKLGIRAPREVPVLRMEVWAARAENEAAARPASAIDRAALAEDLRSRLGLDPASK